VPSPIGAPRNTAVRRSRRCDGLIHEYRHAA
jgi:hypothetical protein